MNACMGSRCPLYWVIAHLSRAKTREADFVNSRRFSQNVVFLLLFVMRRERAGVLSCRSAGGLYCLGIFAVTGPAALRKTAGAPRPAAIGGDAGKT
jgi:hypothetical protein